MQHTRDTLFSRVEALAAQVDRLRERAEELERGLGESCRIDSVQVVLSRFSSSYDIAYKGFGCAVGDEAGQRERRDAWNGGGTKGGEVEGCGRW